jgi:hypothetical protein
MNIFHKYAKRIQNSTKQENNITNECSEACIKFHKHTIGTPTFKIYHYLTLHFHGVNSYKFSTFKIILTLVSTKENLIWIKRIKKSFKLVVLVSKFVSQLECTNIKMYFQTYSLSTL